MSTWGTPSQSSAACIACLAFLSLLVESRSSHSGKRPGATASTKQATAHPSFQSLLKLTGIGTDSGILLLTHARSACFGVIFCPLLSSSSRYGMLIWYFRINVHIRPRINLIFPLKMSLASGNEKETFQYWTIKISITEISCPVSVQSVVD